MISNSEKISTIPVTCRHLPEWLEIGGNIWEEVGINRTLGWPAMHCLTSPSFLLSSRRILVLKYEPFQRRQMLKSKQDEK